MPLIDALPYFALVVISFSILTIAVALITYRADDSYPHGQREVSEKFLNRLLSHASILCMLAIGAFIALIIIDRWTVLYYDNGQVFGAAWTDIHVGLPMRWVVVLCCLVGIVILHFAVRAKTHLRTFKLAGIAVGVPIVALIVLMVILPAAIHWWFVSPNELEYERPYIEYDLAYTKSAYGLGNMEHKEFNASPDVDHKVMKTEQNTLKNIRLLTPGIVAQVNGNKQLRLPFYAFPDVDVDRYTIGGEQGEVMLSARELKSSALPAQTWQNLHLKYTHGYGMVVSPVNSTNKEGLSDYLASDIPVNVKDPAFRLDQPRIYFGEITYPHIYVLTNTKEYDYPSGEQSAEFVYDGPAGIPVGGGLRKLAIALEFDGLRTYTSGDITAGTKILFTRDVSTRLDKLTPFVHYSNDIYQVVADGQIWYMRDGYTTSTRYPYSKPVNTDDGTNYVRNSVKAVVNAYTGKVDLYVSDESDPLLQTYRSIFPELFQPISQMPASLREHLRYPEELLAIQASMLANYHMNSAEIFYNKQDTWQVAVHGNLNDQTLNAVEPYYVTMQPPTSNKPEFLLMIPFTPLGRTNLSGWLAGRCDGENYGKLLLYTFDKNVNVVGPAQAWTRMMQDGEISQQMTLWHQKGSTVIPGNMLAIPLRDNQLLYVQSIFLAANNSPMPELRMVVVASDKKLAHAATFSEALTNLFNSSEVSDSVTPATTPAPADQSAPSQPGSSKSQAELAKRAEELLNIYQKETSAGHYDKAGQALNELKQVIGEMNKNKEGSYGTAKKSTPAPAVLIPPVKPSMNLIRSLGK